MKQPVSFESIFVGDQIPPREFGPLTIVDTVRWAGLQENWQHLHYDRDQVRQHNGLRTFIASGASRSHVDRLDRSARLAKKTLGSTYVLDFRRRHHAVQRRRHREIG